MAIALGRWFAGGVALALASCGSSSPPPSAPVAPPATQGAEAPVSVAAPDAISHARSQLNEVLGWVNGVDIDEAGYRGRFTSEFVSQVPYAKFAGALIAAR